MITAAFKTHTTCQSVTRHCVKVTGNQFILLFLPIIHLITYSSRVKSTCPITV